MCVQGIIGLDSSAFFCMCILYIQYKSKKVPVLFPYNGGSTVLRLKEDCAKTLYEWYGCGFTDRFTTRLYDEAFSSTVYVM